MPNALKRNGRAPPLVPLQLARSEYEDELAALRRDRRIVPRTAEEAERVLRKPPLVASNGPKRAKRRPQRNALSERLSRTFPKAFKYTAGSVSD